MSLSTYAELQARIASELFDRTDLTDAIKDFIRLCETQVERELRHYEMITRETITLDAQYVALPSGHLETIRISADKGPLETISIDAMADLRDVSDTAAEPRYVAYLGNEMELYPTPSQSYTGSITYYGRIPKLSDSNTTNWLLTNNPDIYLYGALLQAGNFLADNEIIQRNSVMYAGGVKGLQLEAAAQMYPGPMKMQIKPGRIG